MEQWKPFNQTVSLREAIDRLVQHAFVRPSGGVSQRGTSDDLLPVDISESDDAFTIKASLPGMKPEDVQIHIKGDTVTIRGQTHQDREARHGDHLLLMERRMSSVVRTLTIPLPIDAEHTEATFENGELTLWLPKSEQGKPHRIKVRDSNRQHGRQDH